MVPKINPKTLSIVPRPDHLIVFFNPLPIRRIRNKLIKNIKEPRMISVINLDDIRPSAYGLKTGSKYFTAKNAITHLENDAKLPIKPFLKPEIKLIEINRIKIRSKSEIEPSKNLIKSSINFYKIYLIDLVIKLKLKIKQLT